jgi:catechol 2,3-dioxygenase-like lactoylglutathione lyase family enzyme
VRVELAGVTIGDPAERWRALGFTVGDDGQMVLGGVVVALGADGSGITGWTLRHLAAPGDVDALRTAASNGPAPSGEPDHGNGAVGIDHVVIVTPDFDRSASVLERRGMELRRIRHAGDRRQGFRRLGPTIMELVEAPEAPATGFWGLTVVVSDLDALAREHDAVGDVRAAVQPGRRIASVGAAAELSTRLAFMDPE